MHPKTNEIALRNKNYTPPKATALAGALAARHECPGARPFPSAPTQRLFLNLATREVLIGGLLAGERDLTSVLIRRQ